MPDQRYAHPESADAVHRHPWADLGVITTPNSWDVPMPTIGLLSMLLVLSLAALVAVVLTVGWFGVGLYLVGWALGWLSAS